MDRIHCVSGQENLTVGSSSFGKTLTLPSFLSALFNPSQVPYPSSLPFLLEPPFSLSATSPRFELPFNIWCSSCGSHVGMGVRYNAEKTRVGNYYTTPIFKFRMCVTTTLRYRLTQRSVLCTIHYTHSQVQVGIFNF